MLTAIFITALALAMALLFRWGFKALPEERWQMVASVPLTKASDGSWRALNLTYYGVFMACSVTFGFAMAFLLMTSIGVPALLVLGMLFVTVFLCVPASRLVAAVVEKRKDTYTIAGAGFVATLLLPPAICVVNVAAPAALGAGMQLLPVMAAAAIAYALAESVGRLACMSFGCCYGKPVGMGPRALGKLFEHYHTVFHGKTKKAVYASNLENQALIPVQALTSIVFGVAGVVGLSLFFSQHWKLALIVPALGTWGWRAFAENLRADHRGHSRISAYQIMSIIAGIYLAVMALFLSPNGPIPDLLLGLSQFRSVAILLFLQILWIVLFLYYGRSKVTHSEVEFHVSA